MQMRSAEGVPQSAAFRLLYVYMCSAPTSTSTSLSAQISFMRPNKVAVTEISCNILFLPPSVFTQTATCWLLPQCVHMSECTLQSMCMFGWKSVCACALLTCLWSSLSIVALAPQAWQDSTVQSELMPSTEQESPRDPSATTITRGRSLWGIRRRYSSVN